MLVSGREYGNMGIWYYFTVYMYTYVYDEVSFNKQPFRMICCEIVRTVSCSSPLSPCAKNPETSKNNMRRIWEAFGSLLFQAVGIFNIFPTHDLKFKMILQVAHHFHSQWKSNLKSYHRAFQTFFCSSKMASWCSTNIPSWKRTSPIPRHFSRCSFAQGGIC